MPLPPPVTKARFPERSITAPPVRNGECGMRSIRGIVVDRTTLPFNSAFRTPHSSFQTLLHHFADQVLDGEMNFLDSRGVVRGNDQHDVRQVLEPTARVSQEAHDGHPARL